MGNVWTSFVFPEVPALAFTNHSVAILWHRFPGKVLPALDDLDVEELEQRNAYFKELLVLTVLVYLGTGTGVLALTNSVKNTRAGNDRYRLLSAGRSSFDSTAIKLMQRRLFVGVLVACYVTGVAALAAVCFAHDSISVTYGPAWEFWVIWVHLGMCGGLLETCLLCCRTGQRSNGVYASRMLLVHAPFLSEKFDTAKDVLFGFVAITAGEQAIGIGAFCLLFVGHCFFISRKDVCAELIETYAPVQSAAVRSEATPQDEETAVADGVCERVRAMWRSTFVPTVLKQTSGARFYISLAEDMPQGMLMLLFAVRQGRSAFVVLSITLSAVRLAVAGPVSAVIHRNLLSALRAERRKAASTSNSLQVLSMTKLIWRASPEDCATDLPKFFTVGDLKAEQASATQIKHAGYPAQDFRESGYALQGMLEIGFSMLECKEGGYALQEMIGIGFSTLECKEAGYAAQAFKENGHALQEMLDVGFSMLECKEGGYAAQAFKENGHALQEMLEIGLPTLECKEGGYAVQAFRENGHALQEMLEIGFSTLECKEGGYAAQAFKENGHALQEMIELGFSMLECKEGGYAAQAFKENGHALQEVLEIGFSTLECKEGGYALQEMIEIGFSMLECKEAGYAAQAFKENGHALQEVLEIGFTTLECKEGGYAAQAFKENGHALQTMIEIGFSMLECKEGGYALQEMLRRS